MKKLYKILTLVCALALITATLAGCGQAAAPSDSAETTASSQSAAPAPAKTVELKLLDSFLENLSEPDVITLNAKIKEFTANHPDIKITRDQSSADVIDTKVPTLASANELPDMFALRSSWVPNFASAGELMSIQDLFKDDIGFFDGFLGGMTDDFTYQDKLYGIPWRSMTNFIMYYNMDMLKQVGIEKVPSTIDELMAAVEAVKKTGVTPIALGDKGKWQSRMWFSGLTVRTAGIDYLEKLKSGEMKFTDPSILQSVKIIDQLAKAGAFNKDFTSIDFTQSRQLYYSKKTAMYGEMAAFAQVEDQQWPEELKPVTEMAFFPQLPGEDLSQGVKAPVSCGWGMGFNSNLEGDKLAAAKLFATEVLGDSYNKLLVENAGIAVRKVESPDLSKIPEAVKRYNEQIAPRIIGGGHIDNRLPSGVLDVVTASLQEMMLGQQTPEQALGKMQEALEKNLTK